jgi:glycosyltransferase involved in cell wall biosynthesis
MFNVSVLIPVFNASEYIERAIISALIQPEVREVIVVDDGSIDNSKEIIGKLQRQDERVKLFQHENNINLGRSASRNLALIKSTQPFIAFLDADDFYLENRFDLDSKIFKNDSSIEGVYNAIGVHFYRAFDENEYNQVLSISTMTEWIPSERLFEALVNQEKGHFSIDGLTIKREVIKKIGLFQENLIVAEDTEWLYKMSLVCKLVGGELKIPLAKRGVHDRNIFNESNIYVLYRQLKYESVIKWGLNNKISDERIDLLLYWLFYYRYKQNYNILEELLYWLFLLKSNPALITKILAIKYCPIIRKRKLLFPLFFK